MRIRRWSSDVCSSELADLAGEGIGDRAGQNVYAHGAARHLQAARTFIVAADILADVWRNPAGIDEAAVGRRSGRETGGNAHRSEEHTSELQSLMRISYAVFCLNKKQTRR